MLRKKTLWLLAALATTAILLASGSEANAFFHHRTKTKTVTVTTIAPAPVTHATSFHTLQLFRVAPSYSYHTQTFSLPRVGMSYGYSAGSCAPPAPAPAPAPVPTNDPVPPPQPLPPVQLPAAPAPQVQQVPVPAPVMPYATSLQGAPAPVYSGTAGLAQLGTGHYGYHHTAGVQRVDRVLVQEHRVLLPHNTVTAALGTPQIIKEKTVIRGRGVAAPPPVVQKEIVKQKTVTRGRGAKTKSVEVNVIKQK